MAKPKKAPQESAEPEKTLGKEAAQEPTNGTPPEEAPSEEAAGGEGQDAVREKTDEIAATYERAKHELNEAVAKLRDELARLDLEKARQRARTWVEENPTLAVMLALGAGVVVGRIVSEALKPAPPPPLSARLKMQGQALASQARHYAHDMGDVVSERAAEIGDVLGRRARELGEDVTRRTKELGEDLTRRAASAVAEASEQATGWGETVKERSGPAMRALQEAGEDVAGAARTRVGSSRDVFDTLVNAAKTVTAAVVVKKVTDWLRRPR